jgi:hypothetical protein
MSGKSAHEEDDSNLQSFLRTAAVIHKLAWLVNCTIVMPPFLTSVTVSSLSGGSYYSSPHIGHMILDTMTKILSTYWTHDIRHDDKKFVHTLDTWV